MKINKEDCEKKTGYKWSPTLKKFIKNKTKLKKESEEDDSPEESFDFDEFLKDYQAESETGGQGIRFAEDIFPEKGGRFKDGRSGGNRRGGQSGGRRGGGR